MGNVGYIKIGDQLHETLLDILPEKGSIKILIIGKTPAPESVKAGHYFQGSHGIKFWKILKTYQILQENETLSHSSDTFPDDTLRLHNYGITDIVKKPHEPQNEPSKDEYQSGWVRVKRIIETYEPEILVFPYKGALDKILKFEFQNEEKANYGFNHGLEIEFNRKVFAMPLPGVGGVPNNKFTIL